jgi:hypothetical protein
MLRILNNARRAGIAVLAFVLASAWPAHAGIKEFNAAMVQRDYAAAATEAEATWRGLDRSRKDAPLIAREFAFAAMLAQKPEIAEPIARWLSEAGAKSSGSGVAQLTADVLWRWSQAADDKASVSALEAAIRARASNPEAGDRISVFAAQDLLMKRWRASEWRQVQNVVGAVLVLAGALAGEGEAIEANARIMEIAAAFLDRTSPQSQLHMAQLLVDLERRLPPSDRSRTEAPLEQARDRAVAWEAAMDAYFMSKNESGSPVREARRLVKDRVICDAECRSRHPAAKDPVEPCQVTVSQSPPLEYPGRALRDGSVGAVYIAYRSDAAGRVTDTRLLAAVPGEVFPEKTLSTLAQWRASRSKEETRADCRMEGWRTMMAVFALEGPR